MSWLIARALWWLGAFACNIGIPVTVGIAGFVATHVMRLGLTQ